MTAFLSFLAFGAGFAACWFSKDKLLIALTGATNFAKSLEAKAAAIKAAL
jgi:hypothetical protein